MGQISPEPLCSCAHNKGLFIVPFSFVCRRLLHASSLLLYVQLSCNCFCYVGQAVRRQTEAALLLLLSRSTNRHFVRHCWWCFCFCFWCCRCCCCRCYCCCCCLYFCTWCRWRRSLRLVMIIALALVSILFTLLSFLLLWSHLSAHNYYNAAAVIQFFSAPCSTLSFICLAIFLALSCKLSYCAFCRVLELKTKRMKNICAFQRNDNFLLCFKTEKQQKCSTSKAVCRLSCNDTIDSFIKFEKGLWNNR